MIKPILVEVPTTVTLHVKQPQIIPYLETRPLRSSFEGEVKADTTYSVFGASKPRAHRDFNQLRRWAQLRATQVRQSRSKASAEILELHLPHEVAKSWVEIKRQTPTMLANPKYKTTLYFVAGKKFNMITGHPDGTQLFVIDDVIYRRLTWRSITISYWNKKDKDTGIVWKTADEFVYFLYKCEKLNKEPIKSIIIDGVGLELLNRDRPQEKEEVGFGR